MSDIVQKLWGFCHTLRHDGIDYGDYIEQITYLLFIKMADERSVVLPDSCDWKTLVSKSGTDLTDHYVDVLRVACQSFCPKIVTVFMSAFKSTGQVLAGESDNGDQNQSSRIL
jgi:hypothetical protein